MGGVSPAKHLGHLPWKDYDHTIGDHIKQGVKKVKKTYKKAKKSVEKGVDKAVDVVKEGVSTAAEKVKEGAKSVVDTVKKDAKSAWDQAGYAYQAYKSTPAGKGSIQTVSDILAVASVPANIITEIVEGVGNKGDKEFNFSDAMPDLSADRGAFNFKNMHGKDTKSVSSVTEIKNPWLAFAVDLATDPSAYVGAGVVKGVVKKSIKTSAKSLVKSADDLTKSAKKNIIKTIDEGPVGPKAKGGVDGGDFKVNKSYEPPRYPAGTDPREITNMINTRGTELDAFVKGKPPTVYSNQTVTKLPTIGTGPNARKFVEVKLPNGQSQVFYKSSGAGGKAGSQGQWIPFEGTTPNFGSKGWFAKMGTEGTFDGKPMKTIFTHHNKAGKVISEADWVAQGSQQSLIKSHGVVEQMKNLGLDAWDEIQKGTLKIDQYGQGLSYGSKEYANISQQLSKMNL